MCISFIHVVAWMIITLLLYGWILFHHMDIPYLFIYSSINGYLAYFYLQTIMNNIAINIHVQFFSDIVFTFIMYHLMSRKCYPIVVVIFISLMTNGVNILSWVHWPFVCLSRGNVYSECLPIFSWIVWLYIILVCL